MAVADVVLVAHDRVDGLIARPAQVVVDALHDRREDASLRRAAAKLRRARARVPDEPVETEQQPPVGDRQAAVDRRVGHEIREGVGRLRGGGHGQQRARQ